MSRQKDVSWDIPDSFTWQHVNIALLMDLRDELKKLNALLNCPNFTAIPRKLDSIRKNTYRLRRKKAKRK